MIQEMIEALFQLESFAQGGVELEAAIELAALSFGDLATQRPGDEIVLVSARVVHRYSC
jgi:hypothetical protein